MDPKIEELFQKKNLVFIATINPDGSPQLTPVWGNYNDNHIILLEKLESFVSQQIVIDSQNYNHNFSTYFDEVKKIDFPTISLRKLNLNQVSDEDTLLRLGR